MAAKNLMKIQEDLKNLIVENYANDKDVSSISIKSNIASDYMLNSVDALELLLKVEQKFNIEIPDDDLNIILLQDAEKLSEYILKLQAEV